jgi:hypothetical protein
VKRRCRVERPVRAEYGEVRISVEVFVEPHRLVHLTAGRALMVLCRNSERMWSRSTWCESSSRDSCRQRNAGEVAAGCNARQRCGVVDGAS